MIDPDRRDAEAERLRNRLEGLVPEAVKRLALAGVGALFMTEEGVRSVVGDLKLPREVVTNVLAQTERARNDLFKTIADELRKFLEHANLSAELARALTDVTIDVEARIRFRPAEGGRLDPTVEHADVRTGREGDPS